MTGKIIAPILNSDQALAKLQASPHPWHRDYLAMYSSHWQGIVTDPWLMMLPLDDHLVHRGDGVFEACKCINSGVYLLDLHLERLAASAASVFIDNPYSRTQLRELCLDTIRAARVRECILRLYLGRGPGSFTANPFDSVGPSLYIMVSAFHPPQPEIYTRGVKAGFSYLPVKPGLHARVKSCSYLPNVLVKHEAAGKGWAYALWVDPDGTVGECASENYIFLDEQNYLVFPEAGRIIDGLTVRRVRDLASSLTEEGLIKGIKQKKVREDDFKQAREIMIVSTTINVVPVVLMAGRPVGKGGPGPVAGRLKDMMEADILSLKMSAAL
ncbi:MAG: aminotransferase class IV [Desulfarculales bacterium]|jgi:branched-chain amino acid aminotransferase|nr:aminotransferase class IV [Desulfarculales bacterium]